MRPGQINCQGISSQQNTVEMTLKKVIKITYASYSQELRGELIPSFFVNSC